MNLMELYKMQAESMNDISIEHTAAPSKISLEINELKEIYLEQSRDGVSNKIIRHTAHYAGASKMYIDINR